MASERPISLRIPDALRDEIARRVPSDRGDTARDYGQAQALRGALDRYYEICRRHDPTTWLSRAELAIVCDVLNGGLLWVEGDSGTLHIRSIWMGVADAIRLSSSGPLHEEGSILGKHRRDGEPAVDGESLVRRLQGASFADLCALADHVERFWAAP